MNFPFQKYFASKKQYHIFLLLCLTTLLDVALIGVRMAYLGFDVTELDSFQSIANVRSFTFLFLVWNLFLAWIPYLLSLSLTHVKSRWTGGVILIVWLVFFPNAPYIVTDLLHVGYYPPVPVWYDTMLLFSFAWTGLLLGFLSLLDVQKYLEKILNRNWAHLLTWVAIGLCAFGVYLGRYQRWNTWDILTNPFQLIEQILAVALHPMSYISTLGLAVVMAGLLGVGYMTLRVLVSEK